MPKASPDDSAAPAESTSSSDRAAIETVVAMFFDAFVVGPDLEERMQRLSDLFVRGAVITRLCGQPPALMSVEEFIAPRRNLLSSNTFHTFREWPEPGRIEIFRDLAHWFGAYGKEWTDAAGTHRGSGMKSIQLIRTPTGWRITAAAWDDQPEL